MKWRCLARAYGDKPLDRFAVGAGDGLIYIVNPDMRGTDQEIASWSIGFPPSAVYEFDEATYASIARAFGTADKDTLGAMWQKARPLKAELPDIDAVIEGSASH